MISAPKAITFDCAQTLIRVDWNVGNFAEKSAIAANIEVPIGAGDRYASLYRRSLPEFLEVNLTRDPLRFRKFWVELGKKWLSGENLDPSLSEIILEASDRLAYSIPSTLFSLYDDVVPALDHLQMLGIRVAVISNWDISLHRVLKLFGIHDRFEVVLASLEEGVEKPESALFQIALDKMKLLAKDVLHIGDDLIDDLQGARNAGLRAALIDRTHATSIPPFIHSLTEIPKAFEPSFQISAS